MKQIPDERYINPFEQDRMFSRYHLVMFLVSFGGGFVIAAVVVVFSVILALSLS